MIISASRRTDIPALYADWMINRLKEGYALVPDPYDANHLFRVMLTPDTVDCMVFWSKNPKPMLDRLETLSQFGYPYYFQFTLTPYGKAAEPHLPSVSNRVAQFRELSEKLGCDRVIWRYDPILLYEPFTFSYHIRQFQSLCAQLHGYTNRCVLSFADPYVHLKHIRKADATQMRGIASAFSAIAADFNLRLSACSEQLDLRTYGIEPAACIDAHLAETLIGCPVLTKKDPGQRAGCRCAESIDLGTYNTCVNGCTYCYATKSPALARRNRAMHDPASPTLIGHPRGNERITDRKMHTIRQDQTTLF